MTHESSKRRKTTATEAISNAAEAQFKTLQMDMAQKKEQHEILLKIRKEKLELLQMKKQIYNEKLKYWKSQNSNM